MSNAPLEKFKSITGKGPQIAVWDDDRFSISHRYLNKSGDWVDAKSFFSNQAYDLLDALKRFIAWMEQRKEERTTEPNDYYDKPDKQPATAKVQPVAFDDDDIPF